MKNIILIGNSRKFINICKELYRDSEINIISWRMCTSKNDVAIQKISPDLLIICGYDYSSSFYKLEEYLDCNINSPLRFVEKIVKKNTKIIYINTEQGAKSYTFSRYLYAKNQLALRLQSKYDNCSVLSIPTVIGETGRADIFAGITSKSIFNCLIYCGLIKSISISDLIEKFVDAVQLNLNNRVKLISPKLLEIRRTIFIDRVLRITIG